MALPLSLLVPLFLTDDRPAFLACPLPLLFTMRLTVSIQRPKAGWPATHTLSLDGAMWTQSLAPLSEKLTATTSYRGSGIFSKKANLFRSAATIEVDFGAELELCNFSSAQEFIDELHRRIKLVDEMFTAKYPVHSSEAELTIGGTNPVKVVTTGIPQNTFA